MRGEPADGSGITGKEVLIRGNYLLSPLFCEYFIFLLRCFQTMLFTIFTVSKYLANASDTFHLNKLIKGKLGLIDFF